MNPNPIAYHVGSGATLAKTSSEYGIGVANQEGAMQFLTRNDWPTGLQQAFLKNVAKLPMRYFICDNSGSMVASDGHRLIGEGVNKRVVPSSRWGELGDFVRFHAGLAHAGKLTSQFRMLNGGFPITVGSKNDNSDASLRQVLSLLEDSPSGGTPLCRHIAEVCNEIRSIEGFLRNTNQKAAVIIATDGESSDGEMAAAMAPLKELPCWVVVRLCTDEDKVVSYWNNIDKVLELDLDILDDISGEANEVCENNKWLTYGEPLHRMREFGVTIKEMDLLDEGALAPEQILVVIRIILGGEASDYPSPYTDWSRFISTVEGYLGTQTRVWNPITKRPAPWIHVNKLGPSFGHQSFCVIS